MIERLRIRISQIFVLLLILIMAISRSAWEQKAPFVSALLFLIGVFLVGIGSFGRLWCSLYIAGYKTDKLITEGPYSISRNPLYFFNLLGALGVGFASETCLIPFIILLAFTMYYPFVIKSEEAELKQLHKDEFERYLKTVPAFFPKVSHLTEPDEYIVKPVIFRRHIFSALWFVWFVGIVKIIVALHELSVLPNLFNIY